jgi:hypothetical protein
MNDRGLALQTSGSRAGKKPRQYLPGFLMLLAVFACRFIRISFVGIINAVVAAWSII